MIGGCLPPAHSSKTLFPTAYLSTVLLIAESYIGWMIGGGKFSECEDYPDILLTERKQSDGVRRQHASLAHNYTSGAFLISALGEPVILDGTESFRDGQRLIHKRRTSIEIGNLRYILELEPISDQDYRTLLTSYQNEHALGTTDYPSNLTATPSEWDHVFEEYVTKNPIGSGVTGLVSAALSRKSGDAVAIKTFRRYTDRDDAHLEADWKMAETIGWHPNICQLISIRSPAPEDPERGYQTCGVDEAYLVYTPLASWTVEKLLEVDQYVPSTQCIGLLREFLDGIEYLHSQKIMHHDIKPSNLAVISLTPPKAMLIDFGHATFGLSASDTLVGTAGWRAPELADLIHNPKSRGEYDETVDLFGLGVSLFRLFCQVRRRWWEDRIREQDVLRMGTALLKLDMAAGVAELLISLMDWDPTQRPRSSRAKEELRVLSEMHERSGGSVVGEYVWGEDGSGGGKGAVGGEESWSKVGKGDKKGRQSAWQ